MPWKTAVEEILSKKSGIEVSILSTSAVAGGSINDTYQIQTTSGTFFVKKNIASRYPKMFETEAKGLTVLAEAREIEVPEIVAHGSSDDESFLVLNFIQSSAKQLGFWENFGQKLAELHKHTQDDFGLDHDNYIGSLKQSNRFHEKWTDFFREERLEAQLKLARDNGRTDRETTASFGRFYRKLEEIFPEEPPALLHGDLWGGNFMVNEKGCAVIIDPAVYYGHREMDLAMSQLFGGFSPELYEAYHHTYPLEKGWQQRMDYCNLYPLMVHVNLFGGSYLASVKRILAKF
ncbi:MAG: fructosamine kinase family protein [Bacteroidales bacterium]|nr:fructosamine kinase family protein [Bacteroidales bacterium]